VDYFYKKFFEKNNRNNTTTQGCERGTLSQKIQSSLPTRPRRDTERGTLSKKLKVPFQHDHAGMRAGNFEFLKISFYLGEKL
jgi:hypothetical protein